MSSINIKNLFKKFDNKEILKDINLEVDEGSIISLFGPSGCGKSTTLKIITGIEKQTSGDVFIGETCVNDVLIEKRGAILVFQDYLLFPHMTVEKNIAFGLKMKKTPKKEIEKKVAELLKLTRLEDLNKRFPHELSGGQKQRVAIARALAVDPNVLLLDEPFSNLDSSLREELRDFIQSLQKKLKITTILVTHDFEEALMISDKIAVMSNGEIIQYDVPENIYLKPLTKEVSMMFGEKNFLKASVKEGIITSPLGKYKVDIAAGEYELMIRPESINLTSKNSNLVCGTVLSRKYAGNRVWYNIELGSNYLLVNSNSSNNFKEGEEVSLINNFSENLIFKDGILI